MAEKNQKIRKPVIDAGTKADKKLKTIGWLLLGSGILAIVYWILFYATDIFYIAEVEAFEVFRKTSIFGGIWYIIISITAGATVMLKKEDSLVYGALTGGTLIFSGLLTARFFFANSLYNHMGFAMVFEAVAVFFMLFFGSYLATRLWNNRNRIIVPREAWSVPPVKKKKKKK